VSKRAKRVSSVQTEPLGRLSVKKLLEAGKGMFVFFSWKSG